MIREVCVTSVGILGAGVMGKEIAISCAAFGFDVVLCDSSAEVRDELPGRLRSLVRGYRLMPDGPRWDAADVLGRITVTGSLRDLTGAAWLIENITERRDAKELLYRSLAEHWSPGQYLAINTSCIPITRLAGFMPQPERVVGMHFMNPVVLVQGLEVIRSRYTDEDTVSAARDFANTLGKVPVVVNDQPGFVSNRLSHLFMNEAAFLVQEGVADAASIDTIFRLGYSHRMGPLETADLIGLDTVVNSLAVLYDEFQDSKFRCCPLLKTMVAAGELGRKSGRGFYDYSEGRGGGSR